MPFGPAPRPVIDRFNEQWELDPETGCWVWIGARVAQGYGVFTIRRDGVKKVVRAHRLSWELFVGPIPDGMWVLHHCDNPPCVNREHLFLGDALANNRDMIAKGRERHVTNGMEQRTHCKRGHEFTPENTFRSPGKAGRRCRTCSRDRDREVKRRLRARRRQDQVRLPPMDATA